MAQAKTRGSLGKGDFMGEACRFGGGLSTQGRVAGTGRAGYEGSQTWRFSIQSQNNEF